jgi:hypothetical protein
MNNNAAIAMEMGNIWIPPNGRPYWKGGSNAGPHLTDEELDKHDLSYFKKYPFDEIWVKSLKFRRRK